jgi:hypothetical protein
MADVPAYAPLADDADLVKALADVVNEGRHLWYGDCKAQSEAELDAIRFIIDRTREAQRLIDQRQLRAAPREPGGDLIRRADVLAAIREASVHYEAGHESWLVSPHRLSETIQVLAASRPDAGDGTGETT